MWKKGNSIVIKVETLEVILSISPKRHPKQYQKLLSVLDGDSFPPVITYNLKTKGENEDV